MATLLLKAKGDWQQFLQPLRDLERFRTHGSLYGVHVSGEFVSTGRLCGEYYASLRTADYVVVSYETPIAWHTPQGWVMPDNHYSVTTTIQQGRIGAALSVIDDWAPGHEH